VQNIGSGAEDIAVSAKVTGLSPNITYLYRVAATNAAGTVYGADVSFTTPSITVAITSPSQSNTIYGPDIMVTGTINNTAGNETGVTVNGIVATVYGNQFVANHIPLTEGTNTITVTAKDTTGKYAITSITVNANTPFSEAFRKK